MRTAAKAARKAAAEADRAAGGRAAAALRDLFMAHDMALADTVVSAYWPMGDEMDPRPLLQALAAVGCRLALPALRGPGRPLDFRAWAPGDPLFPAGFGTEEPAAESPLLEPQVLLVPLLAFDALGYRLGYGGGFYDRSLALLRTRGDILALGLAFSAQQVGQVPRDGNDQKLDGLVTEKAVIRF
ncbi:5-formyltetrahydrofolate cyclo-ligase [Pelagibius litoralis]|uniref:5-formyltetrahydrofolate cyclo-ligase n=1 Tax=Pelagibius litoralis TaxID=374515 RepID=A0A967KGN9_9PROT|nr:5-formyltetrahydrofolate cyclo-ligase [Pelagibius litoralis]